MSRAELTDTDRRLLADRLRARHRELKGEIHRQFADHDDPQTMALRNRPEDTDDWAVADSMQGLDIAMVSRDISELSQVEAALKGLADGTYGRCAACDEPIPAARLLANPAAVRCIRCQEALERRGPGTPSL